VMANVNLADKMRDRVKRHIDRFQEEFRARNPAIPDDIFDFSGTGLPSQFDYYPVEVPNPNSPVYSHQVGVVQAYLQSGFEFLTTDLVSRDGVDGTARLPDFVPIDDKVTVGGCYILFADRDWHEGRRQANVQQRNAILDQHGTAREESLESRGGKNVRVVDSERRDVQLEQLMREEGEIAGGEDD